MNLFVVVLSENYMKFSVCVYDTCSKFVFRNKILIVVQVFISKPLEPEDLEADWIKFF